MEFDKKAVLAIVMIGLILLLMQTEFYQKRFLPQPAQQPEMQVSSDSSGILQKRQAPQTLDSVPVSEEERLTAPQDTAIAYAALRGEGEDVTVRTDLYRAVFSTKGGAIRSLELFEYLDANDQPVQLVGQERASNLALLIPTEGDTLDTGNLVFETSARNLVISERNPQAELVFTLSFANGRKIRKTLTFFDGRYSFDMRVEFVNMDRMIQGFSYYVSWKSGMESTEPDIKLDMQSAKAYALQGDLEDFNANDPFQVEQFNSSTQWVAMRTKYFAAVVIPRTGPGQGVTFTGTLEEIGDVVPLKRYGFDLQMPFDRRPRRTDDFTVYLGPLDYDIVKSYGVGLEGIMDLGFAIIRPFSKFVLWSFTLLHKVIPNYGFVLVIFSFLVKVVLFPLTRKSSQSMKEMQALQPLMKEMNEKYKDDQQKKTEETMKLYKEYGINPVGGCLPMMLQMPLLYAMFTIFRSTIELRGAPFIFWITDLSLPDTVALLPFSLPLYGNTVNILPLFMGVTMFIQQKMTVQDPKQKAMVYVMPFVFTLMFNSFPSGLNLYYSLYNLLSIVQDKLIPYKTRSPEELRKAQLGKKKKRRAKFDYRGRSA